jgi:hypothetical protein
MNHLPHQQGSVLFPWCYSMVSLVTSNLCVPTGKSELKVEWAHLTAPACKYRCEARVARQVHLRIDERVVRLLVWLCHD